MYIKWQLNDSGSMKFSYQACLADTTMKFATFHCNRVRQLKPTQKRN